MNKKIRIGFGWPRYWYGLRLIKRIQESESCCYAFVGYKEGRWISFWFFGVWIKIYK